MNLPTPGPYLQCAGEPSIPWEQWKRSFAVYSLASGLVKMASARQAAILLTLVGEEARRQFFAIPDYDDTELEAVLETFDGLFNRQTSVTVARYKFRQRRQGPGESVSSFSTSLRLLAKACDFGKQYDEHMREQFIVGLSDVRLKEQLLMHEDYTFDKCLQVAALREQVKEEVKEMSDGVVKEVNSLGKKADKKDGNGKLKDSICYRCGSLRHKGDSSSCPARKVKCRNCQKEGHYARVCKSKKNQGPTVLTVSHGQPETLMCNLDVSIGKHEYKEQKFTVDTGSPVSIIPLRVIGKHHPMCASKVQLTNYDGSPIETVKGTVQCLVRHRGKQASISMFVVDKGISICGLDLIQALEMDIQSGKVIKMVNGKETDYLKSFAGIADEQVGVTEEFRHRIRVHEEAIPHIHRQRRLPLAIRDRVNDELKKMVADGVIEPVGSSPWVHPMVVTKKSNGQVRICCDLRKLNEVIVADQFPLPTIEELHTELHDAKIFTKLDLYKAYFHVPLAEESRELTTFATPAGLFRYKRLPMGLKSSPSVFQRLMHQLFGHEEGVLFYQDDILVYGRNLSEHDTRLNKVLETLQMNKLHLNKQKCLFATDRVDFLGHVIEEGKIRPKEDKLAAILHMPVPKNVAQVRTFLGMVGFYGKFIPNLARTCRPLYELLQKDSEFNWSEKAQEAWKKIKNDLANASSLSIFDSKLPIIVATDASGDGIGACLLQVENGEEKAMAFASRTLTDNERKYSITELEALACVFAVEKWHLYLYGREFTLRTDHKALETVLTAVGKGKKSFRLSRWYARLLNYTFKVEYVKGADNHVPDLLSRLPSHQEEEHVLIGVVQPLSAIKGTEYDEAMRNDVEILKLKEAITEGWPKSSLVEPLLKAFVGIRKELQVIRGRVYKAGKKMLVPKELRWKHIELAHEGHNGIVRTKRRIRQHYWWPGMDKDVENYVSSCQPCCNSDKSVKPLNVPVQAVETPEKPWTKIAVDICGPFSNAPKTKRFLLVLTDYTSKWPEVKALGEITSAAVIKFLTDVFDRFGNPMELVTDNGKQFTSSEFERFLEENRIHHNKTAVYNPMSNGRVERLNRTLKEAIQVCVMQGYTWEGALSTVLRAYRTTPMDNGKSPADMMLTFSTCTKLTPEEHAESGNQGVVGGGDADVACVSFQVGDWVRSKLPHAKKGESVYSCPKRITKQVGKYTFRLDDGNSWNARKLVKFKGKTSS